MGDGVLVGSGEVDEAGLAPVLCIVHDRGVVWFGMILWCVGIDGWAVEGDVTDERCGTRGGNVYENERWEYTWCVLKNLNGSMERLPVVPSVLPSAGSDARRTVYRPYLEPRGVVWIAIMNSNGEGGPVVGPRDCGYGYASQYP